MLPELLAIACSIARRSTCSKDIPVKSATEALSVVAETAGEKSLCAVSTERGGARVAFAAACEIPENSILLPEPVMIARRREF